MAQQINHLRQESTQSIVTPPKWGVVRDDLGRRVWSKVRHSPEDEAKLTKQPSRLRHQALGEFAQAENRPSRLGGKDAGAGERKPLGERTNTAIHKAMSNDAPGKVDVDVTAITTMMLSDKPTVPSTKKLSRRDMLLAQSQKPESPSGTPSPPQLRSAALMDVLRTSANASAALLSPEPAPAASAGGSAPATPAPGPASASASPAAQSDLHRTPSPAASVIVPPQVADASRPFSRLQRLIQVAETDSPASSACTPPVAPGSADAHALASPALFLLSPPSSAEGPTPGARPGPSAAAAGASAHAVAAEEANPTPTRAIDMDGVQQQSTPEAPPAAPQQGQAAPQASPEVPPTPAPPTAVAPQGQPVMAGAFVEIVRSVSSRHKRPSDTAASHSGRFEIRTPAATAAEHSGAELLCAPSTGGSQQGDQLTTACHAAVEWGRRAGVAAAQIDKLRAEVNRFRLEAAHWLQQHRELSVQHKAEMARHKQEFAIYQREMEAAISALEAQYRMDTELAKSQHEAAFRAGIAAARAEGMALASSEGVTVSMAADAALAAAARAAAAIERQRADEAERRAAVAEAALAQLMAEREQERVALSGLLASARKQPQAQAQQQQQQPPLTGSSAASAAAQQSPVATAPVSKVPAASFRSRALALLAESDTADKENASPASSSGGSASPAASTASASGGASKLRRGAGGAGVANAAAAAVPGSASRRGFGGCMSPPKTAEVECAPTPAAAAAPSAEAPAAAADTAPSAQPPQQQQAAPEPVQETPIRNLAAPFRMAVLPEGDQVLQAADEPMPTPSLSPIAHPLPSTPSSSPGRKGWVMRLGFITLRLGVSHPSRSP